MVIDLDEIRARCASEQEVGGQATTQVRLDVLVALVDELRELRMEREERLLDNQHSYDEGRAVGAREEREDLVALLLDDTEDGVSRGAYCDDIICQLVERIRHNEHLGWSKRTVPS